MAVGRWAGIVVVVSALVGGAYDFLWIVDHASESEPADRILLQGLTNVWRSVSAIGSPGVLIILLAELIDRVTWDAPGEEPGEAASSDNQDGVA